MRSEQIRALTGIRFFAALWVVLYHTTRANRGIINHNFPNSYDLIRPLVTRGTLGVDLFFVLSGFVLALNYLDVLGPRLNLSSAGRFLWLRLSRIWPLYFLVILAAGFMILVRDVLWNSVDSSWVDVPHLFQQFFMVQLWSRPGETRSSWAGPAWSLSAEWLAYLTFPFTALVALRLRELVKARWLFVLSMGALVPLLLMLLSIGSFGGHHAWAARIICEFTSGVILCTAISRLKLTDKQRVLAGWLAIGAVVAMVAWLYVMPQLTHRGAFSQAVFLLFVPLIGFLAVGRGPLIRLLSTRTLVLGGGISYALYLAHGPVLHFYRDMFTHTRFALPGLERFYGELVVVVLLVPLAWVLFHFVEEPSRRLMRRMLDHELPPPDHALIPAVGPNLGAAQPVTAHVDGSAELPVAEAEVSAGRP